MKRLRSGEHDALQELILHFYPALYAYGCCLSPDTALVRDAIQDVFVSLWQLRHRADTIRDPKHYLLTATKRRIIRMLSQNRVRAGISADYGQEYAFSADFSIEDLIIGRQLAEEKAGILRRTLDQLSSRQREAIYLVYFQQLSHARVAELMNINLQSVYNLLHEAIRKLQQCWPGKHREQQASGLVKKII